MYYYRLFTMYDTAYVANETRWYMPKIWYLSAIYIKTKLKNNATGNRIEIVDNTKKAVILKYNTFS